MYAVLKRLLGSMVLGEAFLACLVSVEGPQNMLYLAQLVAGVPKVVLKEQDVYLGFLFSLLKSLLLLLALFPSSSLLPPCSCAVSLKLSFYDLFLMLRVVVIASFLDPASHLCLQSARMERGVVRFHCRWSFSVQHVTILWLWTKKTWQSHLRLMAKSRQHSMPREADINAVDFLW